MVDQEEAVDHTAAAGDLVAVDLVEAEVHVARNCQFLEYTHFDMVELEQHTKLRKVAVAKVLVLLDRDIDYPKALM